MNIENFIHGQYLEDEFLCDKIIDYFKSSPNKVKGICYDDSKKEYRIDINIKNSLDLTLTPDSTLYNSYLNELQKVIDQYVNKFAYCSTITSWGLLEPINIQYYEPGGGYYDWHCERSNGCYPASIRHLVFMTYLNDVNDAGETEFFHQGIKIKPKRGLTVIWPADWTYTHRGIPSISEEKYIVTGWFSFLDGIQEQPVKIQL
jgi:hypothetical protein